MHRTNYNPERYSEANRFADNAGPLICSAAERLSSMNNEQKKYCFGVMTFLGPIAGGVAGCAVGHGIGDIICRLLSYNPSWLGCIIGASVGAAIPAIFFGKLWVESCTESSNMDDERTCCEKLSGYAGSLFAKKPINIERNDAEAFLDLDDETPKQPMLGQ